MTTLRSVVARLASLVRCAGIAYIAVQVAVWHSFYMAGSWRLAGPVAASVWAAAVTVYLRRRWPEALSNVAAHAGTGEAWVEVSLSAPGRVQVTVRDRGVGFDPADVDRTRLGLRRSITERMADCGGQASILSAPGQGTVACLSWPASAEPGPAVPARLALAQGNPSW